MSSPMVAPVLDFETRELMAEILEKKRAARTKRRLIIGAIVLILALPLYWYGSIMAAHYSASSGLLEYGVSAIHSMDSSNWWRGGQTVLHLHSYRWSFVGRNGNPDFRLFSKFRHVVSLECTGETFPALADLGFLPLLPELKTIHIDRVKPEYPGWPAPTPMTGEFLKRIPNLGRIEALLLPGNRIKDRDLAVLAGARSLDELDLSSTLVADQGLKHILKLPNLTRLSLSGSHVTPEGVRQLSSAMPTLYIDYDPKVLQFHPE